jgi:hypothetical protein
MVCIFFYKVAFKQQKENDPIFKRKYNHNFDVGLSQIMF